MGGIAGGRKYVSQGILFKFAIDPERRLYDEDEYCMKTANAELRFGHFDMHRWRDRERKRETETEMNKYSKFIK